MTDYGVIYERGEDGSWHARAADLPVFSVGDTREDAEAEIRSAIALYLEELDRTGQGKPESRSIVGTVSV